MKHHIEVMFDENQIEKKVGELAKLIEADFVGEQIVLIALLRGSAIFLADIARKIKNPCKIDFICVSSYGNSMNTSGNIVIKKDLEEDIENKNVVVIEDIVDTGLTLDKVRDFLLQRKPKKLKICTLLSKSYRRLVDIDVDYIGFEIPDEFVVGYGIDYAQNYRTLPYIGKVVIEKE